MFAESPVFHRVVAGFGLLTMVGLAWLMSQHKRKVPWRIVIGGLGTQLLLTVLILRTTRGRQVFEALGNGFNRMLGFVDEGCRLVFGENFTDFYFAFRVLPTIIFFSSLMAVLYHAGVMQFIVRQLAFVLRHTLGTSGAESLSAAANIFVGQTEAPFVIRPYLPGMTSSELMAIMTGGFATVAGGVLAVYVGFGIDAAHLITASVISAPAGLLIAKVMLPETEVSETAGTGTVTVERETTNVIEAAANGASEGLKLALNVAAMLIAFMGLIALFDYVLSSTSLYVLNRLLGYQLEQGLTLASICGYLFYPLAWLMGIESRDCFNAGQLLGLKVVANELVAYQQMAGWMAEDSAVRQISPRTAVILTYALSGFSNFASIGIQVGGIGGLCPERRADLARLGFRAMVGGVLACCMTACVASVVLPIME
jgi:CNT family concentrative nucleoside transporter